MWENARRRRPWWVPVIVVVVGVVLVSILLVNVHGALWLVNGLAVPVQVTVAGHTAELAPSSRTRIDVPSGTHTLEAVTKDGRGRESLQVAIKSDTAIYNVAGAALIFSGSFRYVPKEYTYPGPENPNLNLLCGQRVVEHLRADYYFEDPPQEITSSRTPGSPLERYFMSEYRSAILMSEGGWKACENALIENGSLQTAAEMLSAVRAMIHSEEVLEQEAAVRWRMDDEAAVLELLREAVSLDDSPYVHELYQHYRRMAGQHRASPR